MPQRTHYEILGVSETASLAEINAAYRKLAQKWHPDKNPGRDTNAIFKEINAAHDCLKDSSQRAKYDRTLKQERMARANANNQSSGAKTSRPPPDPPKPPPGQRWDLWRSDQPPYPLFGVALVALFGWWLFDSAQGSFRTSAEKPAVRETVQITPQPVTQSSPATAASGEDALRQEFARAQDQARTRESRLQAELDRVTADLRREQALHKEATGKSTSEIEALRAELARLMTQLQKQEQAQRDEQQRIDSEKARVAQWDALTAKLFGAPYRAGSACNLPLLKSARCFDVQANGEVFAFTITESRTLPRDPVKVRVTPNVWTLTVERGLIYDAARGWMVILDPAPQNTSRLPTLARQILVRFGFTPEMLRMCDRTALHHEVLSEATYGCTRERTAQGRVERLEFVARFKTADVTVRRADH